MVLGFGTENQFGNYFSKLLALQRNSTSQYVDSSGGILNSDVDPDAPDRRHRVRGISDT